MIDLPPDMPKKEILELESSPSGELYLGSKIRQLRHERTSLTVAALALRVNFHPDSLSKVETNRADTSDDRLRKIALELHVDDLEILKAPLHPRVISSRRRQHSSRVEIVELEGPSFGAQIDQVLCQYELSPDEDRLARGLILDLTQASVLRIIANRPKG